MVFLGHPGGCLSLPMAWTTTEEVSMVILVMHETLAELMSLCRWSLKFEF